MLIDAHVHIGASDTGQVYYGTLSGPEWLGLAESAGISRAVAFAPMMEAGYAAANAALLDWAGAQGGRVRVLARLGGARLPLAEPRPWLVRRALRRRLGRRPSDVPSGRARGLRRGQAPAPARRPARCARPR